MHILLLPSWYPTADDPVNGAFFAEQAEALRRCGHRVSVITLRRETEGGTRVETLEKNGVTEYAVHYRTAPLHLTFFRVLAAMTGLFRTAFREDRPDVIHVHVFQRIPYARALRALYHIPFVVTEHVTWFERKALSEHDLAAAARGYRAADVLVAVSPGLRDVLTPLCPGKEIRVIPNLVSPRFFEGELRQERGKVFHFITVGSLMPKKGMDVLLRAFAEAVKTGPAMDLTICGGGGEREALEALRAELGLEDRVIFTGQIDRPEVAERLRRSQCFVLASRTETFGVVFIEAMACGLPIVMTKTNAWELLVSPETGLAVEVDDVPALTEAMLSVVGGYDAYDPAAIRRACRDRFSAEAVAAQLTELYREVCR